MYRTQKWKHNYWNKYWNYIRGWRVATSLPTYMPISSKLVHCCIHASLIFVFGDWDVPLYCMCVPLYVSSFVNAFSSTYTQNITSYFNKHTSRGHNLHGRVLKKKVLSGFVRCAPGWVGWKRWRKSRWNENYKIRITNSGCENPMYVYCGAW